MSNPPARPESPFLSSSAWSHKPKVDWSKMPGGSHPELLPPLPWGDPKREHRAEERVGDRSFDRIRLELRSGPEKLSGHLLDYSWMSLGMVLPVDPSSVAGIILNEAELSFSASPGLPSAPLSVRVVSISKWRTGTKLGLLRLDPETREAPADSEQGLNLRCVNPLLFNGWCSLDAIQPSGPGQLLCRGIGTPLFAYKGMDLEVFLGLPSLLNFGVDARLVSYGASGLGTPLLEIQLVEAPDLVLKAIGDFFLLQRRLVPTEMRRMGFAWHESHHYYRMREVSSMEEYAFLMHLRQSYLWDKDHFQAPESPEALAHRCDPRARLLGAWFGDELVGGFGLSLPEKSEDCLFEASREDPEASVEVYGWALDRRHEDPSLMEFLFRHLVHLFLCTERKKLQLPGKVAALLRKDAKDVGCITLERSQVLLGPLDPRNWRKGAWPRLFGPAARHYQSRLAGEAPG